MGLFEGITGAFGGGLQNPIAGVSGGLSGMFGKPDIQQTTNTTQLRPFTPGEQRIVDMLESKIPGIMNMLSPQMQEQLLGEFTTALQEEGNRQVNSVFDKQGAQQEINFARSGGGPQSIQSFQRGELGQQRGQALSSVANQARLGAEQLLGNRVSQGQNQLSLLTSALQALRSGQQIGAGSTQEIQNPNQVRNQSLNLFGQGAAGFNQLPGMMFPGSGSGG